MTVLMILFWVGIIAAGVYLGKSVIREPSKQKSHGSPLEILKTRYAKGEISEEEFERMKEKIK